MSARFELEQDILTCWNVTGDIDLLYTNVMERDMTKDEIANVLLGMKSIYEMKFNKAWDSFERTIEEMREAKNASV